MTKTFHPIPRFASEMPYLDCEGANRAISALIERNAQLENGLKMATRLCHLKKSGFCYIDCRALAFCETFGLTLLSYNDLPETCVETIRA